MTVYVIAGGVGAAGITAVQTVANVMNADGSSSGPNRYCIPLTPNGSNNPSTYQGIQLVVVGVGSVQASAQVVASNDGINWLTVGNVIQTATSQNTATAGALGSVPFKYMGAYITAISGTGATATVTLSA